QYTKQREEYWIRNPAMAFRWQENGLLLALASRFTQAHFFHRLKWRFHKKVLEEEIRKLEERLGSVTSFGLGDSLPKDSSELVVEAFRFLKARASSLPEATRADDLQAMAKEIAAD